MKTNQEVLFLSRVILPISLPHLLSPSPVHHPASLPHPVSGEHLRSVLVLDLDNSGGLDPGLAVHLDGNALVSQDGDLHRSTLIQTEMRVRWEDAHCRSRCCPCCCSPGLCDDVAAWWLWIRPSACSRTRPPPPGFYHQTTERRRSAQHHSTMWEMCLHASAAFEDVSQQKY